MRVTRREIRSFGEHAAKKCVDDPVNRAANLGNHLDPRDPQRGFELAADRATDHDIHAEPPQGRNTALVFNAMFRPVRGGTVFQVEDTDMLRHVKYG